MTLKLSRHWKNKNRGRNIRNLWNSWYL